MGNSVMLNGVEYAGEQIAYKDSTYELVSKVAYLIGVPLRIFQNEHEPPKIEIYNRLEQDKNARIIRNLCIIRTAIERNYRKINDIMRMEYRGLLSMPEILPMSSMQQLSNDGISFIKKSSTKLCHHIIEINRLISDRINNCKSLFPIWINWAYIKELFIMPNGLTEDGMKDAADIYYASLSCYPYQMYINWVPMDEGNVLYNDKKFDGEYPDRFEKEIFKYLSLDRQHFPWASQLFEQPRMDRDYFMDLADRFRSPHIWKWEDNMWKLRHTPYEGDSEVLWGDPRGTHHEI